MEDAPGYARVSVVVNEWQGERARRGDYYRARYRGLVKLTLCSDSTAHSRAADDFDLSTEHAGTLGPMTLPASPAQDHLQVLTPDHPVRKLGNRAPAGKHRQDGRRGKSSDREERCLTFLQIQHVAPAPQAFLRTGPSRARFIRNFVLSWKHVASRASFFGSHRSICFTILGITT